MLVVENLSVRYGGIEAVRDASFVLHEGEIVALVGPNGAGKSSCVNALVGLVRHSGTVTLQDRRIDQLATDRMIGAGLTLVPEGRRVFPQLTVRENLIAGGASRSADARRGALDRVRTLFPALESRLGQVAATLSGGEQQMLAIGRALMGNPRVLLLDEPSLGLAPQIVDQIFALIARLRGDGVSILLVEQNVHRAVAIADRAIVMTQGRMRAPTPKGTTRLGFADFLAAGDTR
jgi:branched-chain amino acid transport system ATP-binding protein